MEKRAFFLISAAIILAGIYSWYLRYVEVFVEEKPDFAQIPLQKEDWQGVLVERSKEELEILRANQTFSALYNRPASSAVDLFIAYFNSQKYGSSIHSPRNCLPGSGWNIQNIRREMVAINGKNLNISKMTISRSGQRLIVYYWYITRSGVTNSELGLKGDLVKNSLLGRPTDGALVRLTAFLPEGFNDNPDLRDFLKLFIGDIYSSLPLGG